MPAPSRTWQLSHWPEVRLTPWEWGVWVVAQGAEVAQNAVGWVTSPKPATSKRLARPAASYATGEIAARAADAAPSAVERSSAEIGAEISLVARAKLGDADAFRDLVEMHQQAIGQQMWRFSRQRDEWETLVHDVFVEAFMSLSRYRSEAPLIHWLRKIAVRVGYRFWKQRQQQRSRATEPLRDLADEQTTAAAKVDTVEEVDRLHRVLAKLSPRDRLVITLLYLDERSTLEVSQLTGMSRTLVKVQAFRARQKLKRLLSEEDAQ